MSKKKEMKVETIAEFLARGGEIKRYPMVRPDEDTHYIQVHAKSPNELSLGDGEILFGEGKIKSKFNTKPKAKPGMENVDLSKIPQHIKDKLKLMGVDNGQDDE